MKENPRLKAIYIEVTPEQKKELQIYCTMNDITMKDLVLNAIDLYIEQKEDEE